MARIEYQPAVIIPASFKIPHVRENGKLYTAKVMEDLSDPMDYEQMQEFDARAREKGDPRLISIPMFFQLAKSGMQNKDSDFLNFLKAGIGRWSNFFSAINYSANGKDKIIHYEGTPDEYFFEGNFVGNDDWARDISDKRTLASLTGINNVPFLNKISNSVNSNDACLWRVNSRPQGEDIKRVGGLYDGWGRLNLGASRELLNRNPCFRVELIEE